MVFQHHYFKACVPVADPVWTRGWVEVWLYSFMTAALESG